MAEIKWISRIPGYHYYDTPEDEDCIKKVIFMNKLSLLFGVSMGTLNVLVFSKPVGFVNILGRYAACTLPAAVVSSSFAATTCLTANIRGKVDPINSTLGAFIAGMTFGAIYRSGVQGTFAAVLSAAFAYGAKVAEENGHSLLSTAYITKPKNYAAYFNYTGDWSLTEDRPKGWKKADE